jgi:hypothetical protein
VDNAYPGWIAWVLPTVLPRLGSKQPRYARGRAGSDPASMSTWDPLPRRSGCYASCQGRRAEIPQIPQFAALANFPGAGLAAMGKPAIFASSSQRAGPVLALYHSDRIPGWRPKSIVPEPPNAVWFPRPETSGDPAARFRHRHTAQSRGDQGLTGRVAACTGRQTSLPVVVKDYGERRKEERVEHGRAWGSAALAVAVSLLVAL